MENPGGMKTGSEKMKWIKDLVLAEREMEERGVIDFDAGFDPERNLEIETLEFLQILKEVFVEEAATFNQLKGSSLGSVKIYGISKTQADFMLFRNGHKLIFSMKIPGAIGVYFHHTGSTFVPGGVSTLNPDASKEEHILKAKWGAYGDLTWFYGEQEIRIDYLVRYYMTRFIKESAK